MARPNIQRKIEIIRSMRVVSKIIAQRQSIAKMLSFSLQGQGIKKTRARRR